MGNLWPSMHSIIMLQKRYSNPLDKTYLPTMEMVPNDNGTRGVKKGRFIKPAYRWNCGNRMNPTSRKKQKH